MLRRDFLLRISAGVSAALGAALPIGAVGAEDATAIARGRFRDADFMHRGTGNAVVYRRPDGSRFLRFENFKVTAGPDLHVVLVRHPDPDSAAQVRQGNPVYLGMLKAVEGTQEYEIPAAVRLADFGSVVVYCKIFDVLFAPAALVGVGG